MKRCQCCEAAIADTSVRLICPPCAQSMVVGTNRAEMACVLHGRALGWGEWDNHPVDKPAIL